MNDGRTGKSWRNGLSAVIGNTIFLEEIASLILLLCPPLSETRLSQLHSVPDCLPRIARASTPAAMHAARMTVAQLSVESTLLPMYRSLNCMWDTPEDLLYDSAPLAGFPTEACDVMQLVFGFLEEFDYLELSKEAPCCPPLAPVQT